MRGLGSSCVPAARRHALTRRARKYSTLSPVVVCFSRSRKRYERQGVLVEEQALGRAEQECLADAEARALARARAAQRRERVDEQYVRTFAEHVKRIFRVARRKSETRSRNMRV